MGFAHTNNNQKIHYKEKIAFLTATKIKTKQLGIKLNKCVSLEGNLNVKDTREELNKQTY